MATQKQMKKIRKLRFSLKITGSQFAELLHHRYNVDTILWLSDFHVKNLIEYLEDQKIFSLVKKFKKILKVV